MKKLIMMFACAACSLGVRAEKNSSLEYQYYRSFIREAEGKDGQQASMGNQIRNAQRLTQTFTNVSMSEALTAIAQMSQGYRVQFIYDELEDFTVTTTIEDQDVPSAIHQVIGFYPIVKMVNGQDIIVQFVRG